MSVTAPQRLDVECDGASLRVRGRVPPDLVYLEGHFPGYPIVPGVVQLHWVMELAREHLGVDRAPSGIPVVKFRGPLLPGQDFALAVDATTGLRFEIGSGERVVSSGRVRFDGEPAQHRITSMPEAENASPWTLRIPQAGRMRLLERVVAHDGDATVCAARIADGTPFCRGGRAPAWLAVELLAQALAAHGGLAGGARLAGRRGFLVAARAVALRTRGFAVGERLWVRAERPRPKNSFAVSECALGTGAPPLGRADARERALALGSVTAFVERADAGAPDGLLPVGAARVGDPR